MSRRFARHLSTASLLAGLLAAAPAMAAPATDEPPATTDAPGDVPDEVIVTGQKLGYDTDATSTATRTPTKILDIPQSITSVSRQQIDDQAIRSIGDALRQVPGAIVGQGEGHRDQVVLRGQNTTADFFVDNLRDDIQYYRPLYNLERLEVLRGPNAMIFGRGGGGGVINRVTKVPERANFIGGSVSGNSFGSWYLDADANVKLTGDLAARLNAVHEEFASHRRQFGGEFTGFNPTLRFTPDDRTAFTLSYEYNEDRRVIDRGVPSVNGRPLEGFRDTFFGIADINRNSFTAHVARATVEHRLTDNLTITGRLLYGSYDKFYRNLYPGAAVIGTGPTAQVPVEAYFDAVYRENLFSQTDIVWRTRTGPIAHTLLAGFEFGYQFTDGRRQNGFFDGVVGAANGGLRAFAPLADPFAPPRPVFRPGTGQRDALTRARIFAGYVQDQLKWGPVELLVGLRLDKFTLTATNRLLNQTVERSDTLWSPRAGLVIHPVANVTTYFSYARSYLPASGDQFTSLDIVGAALKPERFDNYEVGVKWEPRPGLLIAADIYQLERTNTRSPGPIAGQILLTGAQRSRGLEVEARGQITAKWNLSLAYALTEAVITDTTAAAPAGRHVPLVPRHSFSAFTRYDFTPRFGAGLGVSYFSQSFTTISNAVTLPGYARVDAALFYKLSKSIEAQLNVENLTNTNYFPTAHTDNSISTGAPINARATLRFRF
ncbi:TonB-dependent siderophore receptor [Sphingomonas sp.]|uniref:TonB-dependent receptor n=1 Tax=Sphingomonas sp. TaxID=28214 RepID=UPI0025D388EA|nr:TonB-dependent siderophore receptor [Sphingomonas sp.]